MASAPSAPVDIPPYQVQPLISNILYGPDTSDAAAFTGRSEVCTGLGCQTDSPFSGSEIYAGCSNGDLLRFALQANGPNQVNPIVSVSRRHTVSNDDPARIIYSRISKDTTNGKRADRQIFLYIIPSLEPVPGIKPIRNVMCFAVDHRHIVRPSLPMDSPAPVLPVDLCVVKRTGIALYSLREQLLYHKEIPLPGGAFLARRIGHCLCIADREQYSLIYLDAVTATPILPISQAPPEPGARPHRPMIVVVAEEEFLILSWTGAGFEYPHVTALLPDQTIQIHDIESQEIVQVLPPPPPPSLNETSPSASLGAERRALATSSNGFLVPLQQRPERLVLKKVNLLSRNAKPGGREVVPTDMEGGQEHPDADETEAHEEVNIPEPDSVKACGLQILRLHDSLKDDMASTFPRSHVLILGPNSVQSLLPVTPISQAETLLDGHRIEDVIQLADQQRKKVQSKLVVDASEAEELAYVYQRVGFQCLLETRFEDAGFCLFQGELDPRILISYFPDLRGALLDAHPTLEVFAVVANIVWNYSPFLAPTTRSAPPTAKLRRALGVAAHDMLEEFLRKWRRVRSDSSTPAVRAIIDTVLAKLFARSEKTTDLYALLDESDLVVLPEVEPVFRATGQYSALCKMYSKRGDDAALLEAWSKLVEGEWTDPEISDPLSDMFALLTARRDRALTQQWGVWLAGKDTERALKLLTAHGSTKRGQKPEDEAATLHQIRVVNPEAGVRFLEHLVLQKRRTDPALHTELVLIYIDEVLSFLADDATSKLWRAKAASYASSPNPAPFLTYFEATTPASPAKHARLRTALFLQTSTAYDAAAAQARLAPHALLLAPELAIIAGKLGYAQEALSLLALTVHDHASAAAFCTSHGAVVPPRAAAQLAERAGLAAWAGPPALVPTASPTPDSPADSAQTQRLLRLLLTIYTSGSPATTPDSSPAAATPTAAETAAANLLTSHAPSFDAPAVLSTLPPHWPLRALSPYLVRTLRTAAHTAHECALVKALAAGQNLAVADVAHAQLRAAGALVEEAADEGDEDGGGEELVLDEKAALASSQAPTVEIGKTGADTTADVVVGSWTSGRSSITNAPASDGDTLR
ncbi:hypothetical protein EDB87DRAFT_1578953 [Lactarius vividus]|nr:hypothetical protein EDB87DRAFT_1578953 [Lactarius vividus]